MKKIGLTVLCPSCLHKFELELDRNTLEQMLAMLVKAEAEAHPDKDMDIIQKFMGIFGMN